MIENLLKRASVRSFKKEKLDDETISKLKQVVNASPTWKNYQDFSAIFITNQKTKDILSECNLKQEHVKEAPLIVLFNADFNFINEIIKKQDLKNVTVDKLHNYLISFTDAIISATQLVDAAVSLGLGTCYLGLVRPNADKVIELLNIKGKCIPTIAIAIGKIDKPAVQIPKHNKVYDEKYDINQVRHELDKYDEIMKDYYQKTYNIDRNYSKVIAKMLVHENADNMLELIEKHYFNKKS